MLQGDEACLRLIPTSVPADGRGTQSARTNRTRLAQSAELATHAQIDTESLRQAAQCSIIATLVDAHHSLSARIPSVCSARYV